ncbi:MAG: hypothetical protein Q4D76_17240 [Oscillospiraceae bacterium]|nr:hypothetical protein [Oscillospiraceae bacterium]
MKLVISYVLGAIASIFVLSSIILDSSISKYSSILSNISTLVSIVLSIVSIRTAYVSEKSTTETLNQIIENNQVLVDKINYSLSENNFNDNNIDGLKRDRL